LGVTFNGHSVLQKPSRKGAKAQRKAYPCAYLRRGISQWFPLRLCAFAGNFTWCRKDLVYRTEIRFESANR
jgi:hypothetical protein